MHIKIKNLIYSIESLQTFRDHKNNIYFINKFLLKNLKINIKNN